MSPRTKSKVSKEEVKTVESAKETKTACIKVLASWKGFSPDCRTYKPSTPIIEFPEPLTIAIDVPLESDLIKNAGVIAAAQLTNQSEPKPQFTPLGMRYIIDQFEAVMKNGEPKLMDDPWEENDSNDFDETETEKAVETKPAKSDEEEWEDEDTTKTNKSDDAPWDEDWDEDK